MSFWTLVRVLVGWEDEWGQVWCTLDQLFERGD